MKIDDILRLISQSCSFSKHVFYLKSFGSMVSSLLIVFANLDSSFGMKT